MKKSKPERSDIQRSVILGDLARQAAVGRAAAVLSEWAVGAPIRTDVPPMPAASILDWETIVYEHDDLSAEISVLRALAVQALIDIADGCADPRERARAALEGIAGDQSEPD
jgi:hypothetical protein